MFSTCTTRFSRENQMLSWRRFYSQALGKVEHRPPSHPYPTLEITLTLEQTLQAQWNAHHQRGCSRRRFVQLSNAGLSPITLDRTNARFATQKMLGSPRNRPFVRGSTTKTASPITKKGCDGRKYAHNPGNARSWHPAGGRHAPAHDRQRCYFGGVTPLSELVQAAG